MLSLSATQLTTFYECPRKWYYNYHIRRARPATSAMNRGLCFHRIFELYHRDGIPLSDIPDHIIAEHPHYADFLAPTMVAFTEYKKKYPVIDFVVVDGQPAIEQEFTLHLEDDVVVRGKIDYIKQIGHRKYITDIKVTGMYLSEYYFGQFELGFQSMLYSYVGHNFWEGIEGFIIDAVMINKAGKMNFEQSFFPLLPNLDEFIDEIYRTAHFIKKYREDEDAFEHRWTSCSGKFGKCPYFDVCKSSKSVRKTLLLGDEFSTYTSLYQEVEDADC